jgi:phosphomannomutase
MPEISRFYGIVVRVHYREHPPPHFHAEYGGREMTVAINGLSILQGGLPPRATGMVIEWAALHQAELLAAWQAAQNRQRPAKIAPLA